MKKFIAVVLCVLMAAVSLTGCSSANKQSVDAIKKEGKIIMATNAEFPPYEYRSEGKVLGVDVDIAEAIAKELGVSQVQISRLETKIVENLKQKLS